jgi:hypothetical protein
MAVGGWGIWTFIEEESDDSSSVSETLAARPVKGPVDLFFAISFC